MTQIDQLIEQLNDSTGWCIICSIGWFIIYTVFYHPVFSNIIYSGIFIDSLEVRQVVDNTFKTHIEEDKKELKNYERNKKRNI